MDRILPKQPKEFSLTHQCSLTIMAIVEEMARADGWKSLDDCFDKNAAIVDTYVSFANAALRAITRISKRHTQH